MKHHYPNCDLGDRCNCQEIDDIEQELEHNMNEEQIKNLIESTYDYCKAELEKQNEIMETVTFEHDDFRVQTHMLGYHKGRLALLENLKIAIR